MQRKTILWLVALSAVVIIAGAAIYYQSRRPALNKVRVGILLSLTGDSAAYGKRSLNGLRLAQEQINSDGGINGKQLELVIEDARSSPKDAVSAFKKLVTVNGMKVVIGDVLSGTTLAVAPLAENGKVVLFAPGASNPALRDAGDYIFRDWTSDSFDGQCMARYLLQTGVKEVGILVENTEYTVGLADALSDGFARGGGKVVRREQFATDTADLRTQLAKLKDSGVSNVYVSAYSSGTGRALRQATELGLAVHWYSTMTVDSPETAQIAGIAREGAVFTTPAFNIEDTTNNEMTRFVQGYRAQYGEAPEVVAGHAYDAMNILAKVMKLHGTEPEAVKRGLYSTRDYPGVTGVMTFDTHGDVVKGVYVKQIKNGSPIFLQYMKPDSTDRRP